MALTEGKRPSDWMVWEQEKDYSRQVGTLITGQNLTSGTVLGIITATGKFTQFNQDGADGSEAAAGILFLDTDATDADVKATVILRDAIVVKDQLVFPDDAEAAEITAAMAELKALGIIEREEV